MSVGSKTLMNGFTWAQVIPDFIEVNLPTELGLCSSSLYLKLPHICLKNNEAYSKLTWNTYIHFLSDNISTLVLNWNKRARDKFVIGNWIHYHFIENKKESDEKVNTELIALGEVQTNRKVCRCVRWDGSVRKSEGEWGVYLLVRYNICHVTLRTHDTTAFYADIYGLIMAEVKLFVRDDILRDRVPWKLSMD